MKFLGPARRELQDAVQYYNAQRENLGSEFRDEVWLTLQRIEKFPEAWRAMSESIRRCQMHRFPYGIIYSVVGEDIVVITVAHLHRRPEHWGDRL